MRTNMFKITIAAGAALAVVLTISCTTKPDDIPPFNKTESSSSGGENQNCTVSEWITYSDADQNSGTSTITQTPNEDCSVTFSGNITRVSGQSYGFAGWSAYDEAIVEQAKTATSISFEITGDGKKYRLQLPTSNILDYDYYYTTFTTTNGTKTVTLCLSNFRQGGWGVMTTLDQSLITGVEWQAHLEDNGLGTFSVTINNLSIGTGACTSSE